MYQFKVYADRAGFHRWTLYAGNGLKVADSGESYSSAAAARSAAQRVKDHAHRAAING